MLSSQQHAAGPVLSLKKINQFYHYRSQYPINLLYLTRMMIIIINVAFRRIAKFAVTQLGSLSAQEGIGSA